jgi:hypothetical protein
MGWIHLLPQYLQPALVVHPIARLANYPKKVIPGLAAPEHFKVLLWANSKA